MVGVDAVKWCHGDADRGADVDAVPVDLERILEHLHQPFGELEIEGAAQLCRTLATAIRQRMRKEQESQRRRATKYDGLLADGVLTQEELHKCIAKAREEGKPVEQVLMAEFQIRPAQIGPSLGKFFGVPYEPFNAGRIRSAT